MDLAHVDIEQVKRLEAHLKQFPQIDLQTQVLVFGGVCARAIFIPAGVALTGALTNMDNICIVFGDISVTTDEGVKRLTGFHMLPAKAGAKRAGVTHADTWWATVIQTELTDPTEIENAMTPEADMLQTRTALTYQETH